MGRILVPGRTCAAVLRTADAGLLIDGRDYYRAVYDLCRQAKRSILMLGWQFDSRVDLLCGDDAEGAPYPVGLLPFLAALCEERPDLRIHILAWRGSPVSIPPASSGCFMCCPGIRAAAWARRFMTPPSAP